MEARVFLGEKPAFICKSFKYSKMRFAKMRKVV